MAKAKRETFEAIETKLAEEAAWIAEFADSPRSDSAAAEALRAHLGGAPSPAGAAALTAITDASGWADFWSERYGLPFAARAATEVFSVDADWQQSGLTRSAPRLRALPGPRHQYWAWHHRSPIDRVRALLAAADEATYRAAVEALAECRTDTLRRIIVSYLVPSETGWVDELCADPAVHAEQDRTLRAMVFSSLYSADQMALLPYRPDYTLGVATIATVAEGVGPAIAPALADTLDGTHYYSDSVKLAMRRPGGAADGRCLPRPAGACGLQARPPLAPRSHAPLSGTGGAAARRRGGRQSVSGVPVPATAPDPCRCPPRSGVTGARRSRPRGRGDHRAAAQPGGSGRRRTDGRPACRADGSAVVPAPHHGQGQARDRADRGLRARAGVAARGAGGLGGHLLLVHAESQQRRHARVHRRAAPGVAPGDLRSAWVFVHGDEDVVAPLLATWDPDDLWDGEDTLKPIAARFGLAALPMLLRAVPRQPSALAPLFLPFVDVDVARHMADWAVRLKSTASTARAWFARHGVAAARSWSRPPWARRAPRGTPPSRH